MKEGFHQRLRMVFAFMLPAMLAALSPSVLQGRASRVMLPVRMLLSEINDPENYDPEKAGLSTLDSSSRPEGSHSTGYRFMPLSTVSKESSPVLICIAGLYPGLSGDDLMRPTPLPFAPPGQWNYHVLSGETCTTGFVALSGSDLLDRHPDTVAVVCSSSSLGLEFPDGNEHEVLALIDRSDIAVVDAAYFDPKTFYALADENNQLHIRWIEAVPAGWRVLGRLLFAQMPFVKRPGAGSGFAEQGDEFEF